MLADVPGREDHVALAVPAADGHGPVGIGGPHHPAVAVFHPPPAGGKEPVVLPGDHLVPRPGHLAVGHREARFGHLAGRHPVGPGAAVQLRHGGRVGGDHEALPSLVHVSLPGPVQRVEQRLALAPGDPPVGLVGHDGLLLPQAQAEAGRLLPLGLEALHLAQFGYHIAPVGHQQPERPARLQGRQLRPVAHQEHLGAGLTGGAHQFVEGEGASQAGLVHYDELAAVEAAGLDGLVQGSQAVAQLPLGGKRHGTGWPAGPPADPGGR